MWWKIQAVEPSSTIPTGVFAWGDSPNPNHCPRLHHIPSTACGQALNSAAGWANLMKPRLQNVKLPCSLSKVGQSTIHISISSFCFRSVAFCSIFIPSTDSMFLSPSQSNLKATASTTNLVGFPLGMHSDLPCIYQTTMLWSISPRTTFQMFLQSRCNKIDIECVKLMLGKSVILKHGNEQNSKTIGRKNLGENVSTYL